MSRILFYVARDMQLPFLEPVHDILVREKGVETVFSAPEYHPSVEIGPGWGLSPEQIKRLEQKSTFIPDASKVNADVAVVADNSHYRLHRAHRVVNIGHGLICKGFYYTDDPVVRKENLSSLICVPGPWHEKRLSRQVFTPIEVTGFIKSDLLCGPSACSKKDFCREKSIPPSSRIVLFAPTFNRELNCLSRLGTKIQEVADEKTTLLVKLHNMTDYKWKEYFRKLAACNKNILYLRDGDYSGMMHAADVMISDVSSIYIEFMLLDKPVILAPHPENEDYFKYDPTDIEYTAREGAYVLKKDQDLLPAVNHVLKNPEEKSEIRKKYRDELDFGRDGKSASRIARAVKKALCDSPKLSQPAPPVSLILDGTGSGPEEICKSLRELEEKNDCPEIRTFLLTDDRNRHFVNPHKKVETVCLNHHPQEKFLNVLGKCTSKYIVCLKCGYFLPRGWIKHFWLDALWNEDAQVVRAMSDPELVEEYFAMLYPGLRAQDFDIHTIQRMILVAAVGQSAPNSEIDSAALIAPKEVLSAACTPQMQCPSTAKGRAFRLVNQNLRDKKSVLALDIYLHHMQSPITMTQKILERVKELFARGEHAQAKALLDKIDRAQAGETK